MKLPILRPGVEAVVYGFERIGMAIRIGWFPILLVLIAYGAILALAGGAFVASDIGEAGQTTRIEVEDMDDFEVAVEEFFEDGPGAGLMAGFFVLWALGPFIALVLLSCVYVAITRSATHSDYEPPSGPVFFRLGGREFRYFAARVLYSIISAVIMIFFGLLAVGTLGLGIAGAEGIGGSFGVSVGSVGGAAALIIGYLGVWFAMRFLPALPIAAVENKIEFGEAWKLTKGTIFRLPLSGFFFVALNAAVGYALLILIFLPVLIILGLIGGIGAGLTGGFSFAVFALMIPIGIAGVLAVSAFSVATEAAFAARLYAYLTDCGDECRVY